MDLVAGTSTGAAWRRNAVTDVSVLSKKLPPTQIYRCHLAPHRCGAQGQYQVNASLQTPMKDGCYLSMALSPSLTTLWASVPRIKAAIMRCGCAWPSLAIMATTYREKGMTNGFSSRKDLLRSSPTRKELKQLKTKATVHFRHNRPYE